MNKFFALVSAIGLCIGAWSATDAEAATAARIVDCYDSAHVHALIGQHVEAYVHVATDFPVGSANLRVRYTFPGLTFLGATATGQFAEWEHFAWSHVRDSLFPDSGYGTIDLIAVADLENGDSVHPDPSALTLDTRVVRLLFWVTNNRNYGNQCPAVLLSDFDCGQLALRSATGDTAYIPVGSDPACLTGPGMTVLSQLNYADGAVCINDPPDDRGDINLNGYQYDVGDAVLLCRYLALGENVWDPIWREVQILSTDTNDDGVVCTVADLVFLVRLVASGGYPTYIPGDCWSPGAVY